MNEYEVTDLFEAGKAGEMIQAKQTETVDENGGVIGPLFEAYEEE